MYMSSRPLLLLFTFRMLSSFFCPHSSTYPMKLTLDATYIDLYRFVSRVSSHVFFFSISIFHMSNLVIWTIRTLSINVVVSSIISIFLFFLYFHMIVISVFLRHPLFIRLSLLSSQFTIFSLTLCVVYS